MLCGPFFGGGALVHVGTLPTPQQDSGAVVRWCGHGVHGCHVGDSGDVRPHGTVVLPVELPLARGGLVGVARRHAFHDRGFRCVVSFGGGSGVNVCINIPG